MKIGSVWISSGGFALEITEGMQDGWYRFNHLNGNCHGYVLASCLVARFTKLGA